ncbi:hypothetical protein EG328_000919 [Venturia inaequalis]|uniref:Major facilitator superfamily (MFS) profile domain-containing protein n=1 Tax=Venturia inaequalis TaxID=5025 RepID=A0A8H3VHB9_VENIN|nr:hypothetical protein EG328_000919 [Venturia inaequalis]
MGSKLESTEHSTPIVETENRSSSTSHNSSIKDNENADVENARGSAAVVPNWKPSTHELLIMLSLAVISLMVSLDASIIITSLTQMTSELGGTATEGFWIGTSYLLTNAVFMPVIASLSDIFGRPVCLLTSLVFFTVGSIVAATAKTMMTLLVGRCVQGIGGGGITILALVIFTDIVPLRFRGKFYGIIQAAWAIGSLLGPVLGGAFAKNTAWRWVFYLMFPFCFVGFATIPFVLTLKPKTETLGTKLKRVDWTGYALFISSMTSFLIAISWGGVQQPWDSWRTIVPLVLGVFGLILTGFWELYRAKEPFLRRSLFYCPSAFAAYLGTFIQGLMMFGCLYYAALYFIAVRHTTFLQAGVDMLPQALALVPISIIVGGLITRANRFRWAVWSGWLIATIGTGLLVIWGANTPPTAWIPIMMTVGIGHGLILSAQNFATQAIALPRDEASAAAMYAFLRSLGSAMGVGIGGSVFQNTMAVKLKQYGLPATIAKNAESYISVMWKDGIDPVVRTQSIDAYVFGIRGTFAFFCGMGGLAGIASLFIKHFDMNKELDSDHKLGQMRGSRSPKQQHPLQGSDEGKSVQSSTRN